MRLDCSVTAAPVIKCHVCACVCHGRILQASGAESALGPSVSAWSGVESACTAACLRAGKAAASAEGH